MIIVNSMTLTMTQIEAFQSGCFIDRLPIKTNESIRLNWNFETYVFLYRAQFQLFLCSITHHCNLNDRLRVDALEEEGSGVLGLRCRPSFRNPGNSGIKSWTIQLNLLIYFQFKFPWNGWLKADKCSGDKSLHCRMNDVPKMQNEARGRAQNTVVTVLCKAQVPDFRRLSLLFDLSDTKNNMSVVGQSHHISQNLQHKNNIPVSQWRHCLSSGVVIVNVLNSNVGLC